MKVEGQFRERARLLASSESGLLTIGAWRSRVWWMDKTDTRGDNRGFSTGSETLPAVDIQWPRESGEVRGIPLAGRILSHATNE